MRGLCVSLLLLFFFENYQQKFSSNTLLNTEPAIAAMRGLHSQV